MKPNPNSKIGRTVPNFLLTHKVTVTVLRKGEGSWVDGYWKDGTDTSVSIEANVQPLKGYELMSLPEVDRTKESIKVYCEETLRTLSEVGQTKADLIIWEGKKYQAVKTLTYKMGVLDHTKTICYRLPETPQNQAVYVSQ
jgi:hypothetical protein